MHKQTTKAWHAKLVKSNHVLTAYSSRAMQ